jgi:hypothetical protein
MAITQCPRGGYPRHHDKQHNKEKDIFFQFLGASELPAAQLFNSPNYECFSSCYLKRKKKNYPI